MSSLINTSAAVKISQAPQAQFQDKNDDQRGRWNRSQHEGFHVGRYVQAPPMFFTQDHHPLWIGDIYRGRSAFLIAGGPSFGQLDRNLLGQPGILTMGLNNSPRTFRPNMWASVDSPDHFIKSIWLDPTIQKFVPICHSPKKIFDNDSWKWTGITVGDCPNVVYYRRNEKFQPQQFLWEDTINWGNHSKLGGGRSIMLAAIRILFLLGVRNVYLLGVDFTMDEKTKYHFDQERSKSSIKGNQKTYRLLNERFDQLRPIFECEQFYVWNCNEHSGLKTFDYLPYDVAIKQALNEFGNIDTKNERTNGLYDTPSEEKGKTEEEIKKIRESKKVKKK